MMQVGRNLTDPFDGFLRGKRFLILDRDKKFTTEFRDLLKHAETDVIRLPHRSPNLNAYVERFVLSIKSECLERMIFFSEQSLRRATGPSGPGVIPAMCTFREDSSMTTST